MLANKIFNASALEYSFGEFATRLNSSADPSQHVC